MHAAFIFLGLAPLLVLCLRHVAARAGDMDHAACVTGLEGYLCTMRISQNGEVNFTVDPLLQSRYMNANGSLYDRSTWPNGLEAAPSVFPDKEFQINTTVGGALANRKVTATAYVDYFWCSDGSCETMMDLAYRYNATSGGCDLAVPVASIHSSLAGFGLPHSVAADVIFRRDGNSRSGSTAGDTEGSHQWCVDSDTSLPEFRATFVEGELAALEQNQDADVGGGGVHILLTRFVANLLSKEESPIAVSFAQDPHSGACTMFVHPAYPVLDDMFRSYTSCDPDSNISGASNAIFLDTVALPDWYRHYLSDSFSMLTTNTMAGPYVSDWRSSGLDCNASWATPPLSLCSLHWLANDIERLQAYDAISSQYSTKFPSETLSFPGKEECAQFVAGLNSSSCAPHVLCRTHLFAFPGLFQMAAINITAHMKHLARQGGAPLQAVWGGDTQLGVSGYGAYLSRAFFDLIAEAKAPAVCHDGGIIAFHGIDDPCVGWAYDRLAQLRSNTSLCERDARSGQFTAPTVAQFLQYGTTTRWAFAGKGAIGGVHGYDRTSVRQFPVVIRSMDGAVKSLLQQQLTQQLAATAPILTWIGALFVLLVCIGATLGAVMQIARFEDSIKAARSRWILRFITVYLVVSTPAVPLVFTFVGEYTKFQNNLGSDQSFTYAQLAADSPGYSAGHRGSNSCCDTPSGHKIVALVAMTTTYDTQIMLPCVLYGISAAISMLTLFAYFWAMMNPQRCRQGCCGPMGYVIFPVAAERARDAGQSGLSLGSISNPGS